MAKEPMKAAEARALGRKLAEQGLPTFPIALEWNHEKGSIDKPPLTTKGFYEATADPDEAEKLFLGARLGPRQHWGVGVRPGPAGYVVLDVDVKSGATGLEDLRELEKELGALPPATRVTTASGGFHLWFRRPDDGEHIGNRHIAPGVEIRCDGGYVVASGVVSMWGDWLRDPDSPRLKETPPLPPAWVQKVKGQGLNGKKESIPERLTAGSRHHNLVRLAGAMRRQGAGYEEIHAALSVMNEQRGDPPHPPSKIEEVARDISTRYQPDPDLSWRVWLDKLEAGDGSSSGVHLVRASRLTPETVEYFEEGLIPLRVVTLITGVDGVGKSTILYTKGARATRGALPGAFHGRPVDVVIASVEDHPQSVILPRLIAAGADLERVHIVKVERDGLEGEISLPDDLPAVADRVQDVGARLLIIDPLIAYMPLSIDGHKAQHIRSVLAPLARLAEDEHLAVGAVVHFNGSPSTDVRTRISGSKALRDAARSVLVCGEDPEDESRFLLIQDKNSFGPKPSTGTAYRIETAVVEANGKHFPTSRVVWLGEVPITARQMLAGPGDQDERTDRDIAADVILDALTTGPKPWDELVELCKDAGVNSEATARRARNKLKDAGQIDKFKDGAGAWLWNLLTPDEQVHGEQVQKQALTRDNADDEAELAHTLESEQVHPSEADSLLSGTCHRCGKPGGLDNGDGRLLHADCALEQARQPAPRNLCYECGHPIPGAHRFNCPTLTDAATERIAGI